MQPINIVDLFAGPGGLGEGFAAYPFGNKTGRFRLGLSIEKDPVAATTLRLRSFTRQFKRRRLPDLYYELLSKSDEPLDFRLKKLFGAYENEFKAASDEAWCTELGKQNETELKRRIKASIQRQKNWVLVGGPPCQAYSLVGRSRNKGNEEYKAEDDSRQYLYKEYLKVIADHKPAVFVMENVKGLLSATVRNKKVFESILSDLQNPSQVFSKKGSASRDSEYEIFSIVRDAGDNETPSLTDYVVKMEQYGVPQARHRIILLGVRRDIAKKAKPRTLTPVAKANTTKQTIGDLPKRLRSGLSKQPDTSESWIGSLKKMKSSPWNRQLRSNGFGSVVDAIGDTVATLTAPKLGRGSEFVRRKSSTRSLSGPLGDWFLDANLDGTLNHSTRGHIASDLQRYLFAACFAKEEKRSPTLSEFPTGLLPNHKNVGTAMSGSNFADRFRVQVADRPSTTITCHISKDGHYYIHHDPSQCRSLTVREAARLQTFPDNYFFCGPRTKQYIQVGNAVPPYLAHQIAEIVFALLKDAKAID